MGREGVPGGPKYRCPGLRDIAACVGTHVLPAGAASASEWRQVWFGHLLPRRMAWAEHDLYLHPQLLP